MIGDYEKKLEKMEIDKNSMLESWLDKATTQIVEAVNTKLRSGTHECNTNMGDTVNVSLPQQTIHKQYILEHYIAQKAQNGLPNTASSAHMCNGRGSGGRGCGPGSHGGCGRRIDAGGRDVSSLFPSSSLQHTVHKYQVTHFATTTEMKKKQGLSEVVVESPER